MVRGGETPSPSAVKRAGIDSPSPKAELSRPMLSAIAANAESSLTTFSKPARTPRFSVALTRDQRESHVVDIPPEEDQELGPTLRSAGVDMIRLSTPTTDKARLPAVLDRATGRPT